MRITDHRFSLVISYRSCFAFYAVFPCSSEHGLFRRRFELDREPGEARFCSECSKCHSAEEGDLWAESSMLGLRITYYAFMDGKVFDITGSSFQFPLSDRCCVHMLLCIY